MGINDIYSYTTFATLLTNLWRRLGRIDVSRQIMSDIRVMSLLYQKVIPYRIEPHKERPETFTIYCISDHFKEIDGGDEIPLYVVTISNYCSPNGATGYTLAIGLNK